MTSLPKRARSSKRTSTAPVARVSEVNSLVMSPEMVSLTPSKQLAQAIDFSLTKASTEEG